MWNLSAISSDLSSSTRKRKGGKKRLWFLFLPGFALLEFCIPPTFLNRRIFLCFSVLAFWEEREDIVTASACTVARQGLGSSKNALISAGHLWPASCSQTILFDKEILIILIHLLYPSNFNGRKKRNFLRQSPCRLSLPILGRCAFEEYSTRLCCN